MSLRVDATIPLGFAVSADEALMSRELRAQKRGADRKAASAADQGFAVWPAIAAELGDSGAATGRRKMNREPSPTRLSTQMLPRCSSISPRVMARPSPV